MQVGDDQLQQSSSILLLWFAFPLTEQNGTTRHKKADGTLFASSILNCVFVGAVSPLLRLAFGLEVGSDAKFSQ